MRRSIFLFFYLVLFLSVKGAVPALEREVSLSASNEQIATVLLKIQNLAGVVFSYPSSLINSVSPVSINVKQKTVREILSMILPQTIYFKPKDNYIILKEKPADKKTEKKEINGYVYDKSTNKKIANVTVYDKKTLKSTTTDDYGYYSLTVPSKDNGISINKFDYKDTSLILPENKNEALLNISLDPLNDSIRSGNKDWQNKLDKLSALTEGFIKKLNAYINTINVKDSLTKDFQVSFLPYIGTNHKLSGNIYNRFSFNVLGGYSKGTKGFELGGLFNINKEHTRYGQLAGLFNTTGGNMTGLQTAGLYNLVSGKTTGAQIAGLFNVNNGNTYGIAVAGLFNVTRGNTIGLQAAGFYNLVRGKTTGAQIAGLFNVNTGKTNGITVAGLFNHSEGSMKGIQIAGLVNSTNDTLSGISIAGLLNTSKNQKIALQIAGVYNYSKEGSANVQIAGLFNHTKILKGIQIAPFNFSDSASGVPIGFFSFVKKGVHQIEISGDEVFYTNLSFRTGVPAFYNIFSAGVKPGSNEPLWQIGYGFGTSFLIKNKLRSDFTLSTHHLSLGNFSESLNEIYKAYFGLEYKFTKKFSMAAGPTFNFLLTDIKDSATLPYRHLDPYETVNTTSDGGYNLKGWIGGRIALRFL